MGDTHGFLKVERQTFPYRPVCERVTDYREVARQERSDAHSEEQASRCMDCGTPFCHWGCPVGNLIPEWNDHLFHRRGKRAYELLQATNNFPEFTGRLCPAICEYACVLGINDEAVTIRENELAIVERAFKSGLVRPRPPRRRTGRRIAVIGSGPAGLACADQLNKAGHTVTVLERDDRIGGVLRYGIPDFKLEKWVIDRRLNILKKEGIRFLTGTDAGGDYSVPKLKGGFDAISLAGGSRVPRDLAIEGRGLAGIYFAMEYLTQANRAVAGERPRPGGVIDARGKRVVVIGGGDTGADCVGTAHRQGASCVVQIEVMPQPPACRNDACPWPRYPLLLKTSTSHEEGGERQWSILTKRFIGESGTVKKISCVRVEFVSSEKKPSPAMREIPGTEFEIDADLVILAVGYLHPEHGNLLKGLGVELDERGGVKSDERYMTSAKGVFASGDMKRGQSLVVWAIYEGRQAARAIDLYLTGETRLPQL